MRLTEQMVQDEDKRWAGRNFLAELKFCGREITDRQSITNDNIRFYAWLCRRADEKIEEQRNKISDLMDIIEQQAGRKLHKRSEV